MTDAPITRPLTRAEFNTAIEWAAAEGWNPGLDDRDPFHGADPAGFLGTWLDDRLIACISAVRYGADFGFIGFYLCHPDYRGQGYGLQTWNAAIADLGDRVLGLDGVVDQQSNYAKSGFELAHRNVRLGGHVAYDMPSDPRLQPVTGHLVDAAGQFDARFFPADRTAFARHWLGPAPTRSGIAVVDNGDVTGYGVIRGCRTGFKIGPLFADNASDADLLFRALAATTGGATVYLDPPEPNAAAIAMATRHGLTPVFETARMYRGAPPGLPLSNIFGITTFELG